MTELQRLEAGQQAPDFTLPDHEGKPFALSSLAGKKVIVYFYPAANTPACSKEANDFNEELKTLKAAGYEVVGISPDAPKKLTKFKENQGLKFPLLSDEDLAAHKLYGAYGEKSLYGRLYTGVLRSTFVVGEDGKLIEALYNVKATGHVAMILKRLGLAS
ncbi:MAG: thioredoxin-dependent thiol peroxidase [Actinomycetales bacterium]|nr:thioredoxin-dependent thiol peroxidase [Actinomycetales bacterium]